MRLIGCIAAFGVIAVLPFSADGQVINEWVANHTGTDTHEFVEFFGAPNTDYSDYWIVEIEGEGTTARGLVDDATYNVGTTDANGIWWSGFVPNVPENGSLTFLLVTGFTGTIGTSDIDANDDGIIDTTFWTSVVDAVGVFDGTASDFVYTNVSLDSSLPPAGFTPGGASRFPNGVDTDSTGDWCRNDFDGAGLPGFSGTVDPGECPNTPGAINVPEPASLALMLIGGIAALRRRHS